MLGEKEDRTGINEEEEEGGRGEDERVMRWRWLHNTVAVVVSASNARERATITGGGRKKG